MKALWRRNGHQNLLVFCNGWGMDAGVVEHLTFAGDLLILSDFTDFTLPPDCETAIKGYARRSLICWSMGVWMAARLMKNIDYERKVAVNGTLKPVDDNFGIPEVLFHGTLEKFDEKNRLAFYRRMCGSQDILKAFLLQAPVRELEDQRQELAFYWTHRRDEAENFYDLAVVARKDRIMPTVNQLRFWQGTPVHEMKGGHYPFFSFSCWEELLNLQR